MQTCLICGGGVVYRFNIDHSEQAPRSAYVYRCVHDPSHVFEDLATLPAHAHV